MPIDIVLCSAYNFNMSKKERIIRLYQKKKLVHPSMAEIAKKVGTFKSYVWKVLKEHKK